MLGPAELSWLVDRIRAKLERGERLDGTVTLVGATTAQRRAVARLLGRNPGRGTSLSVPLPEVATELFRAAAAPNLRAAVEELGGPVRDLAAERAADLRRFGDTLGTLRSSNLAGLSWYREWMDAIRRDGTATKLLRQGHADLLQQAAAVLEQLPADTEPPIPVLSSLAAAVTGDEHALTEGPLAGLVLRALAIREGVQAPVGRDAVDALWSGAGMVADELASQVLVLNVRAGGQPVGRWLTEAADEGQPFRLTLGQLLKYPVLPFDIDLYVCANSAVLRAAADQLGPRSPALVCTEGEPSVACNRLLRAAVSSGSAVRWHADFSWTGLRSTAAAVRHVGARPWRMDSGDFQSALSAGGSEPLKGRPEPSPWDPRLTEQMQRSGRMIAEDRLVPALISDLAEHQRLA
jgi:uncharacterized protein (TIGR02679 family)